MCESLYTLRDRLFCLFFAIFMVGCAQAGKESAPTQRVVEATRPQITAENFPRLDGSTSAEPILAQIVCEFFQASCEWYDWIDGERRLVPVAQSMEMQLPTLNVSGTHEAYLSLIAGESDLILVARVPSTDERALAQNSLVALDIQPIALDAFVFIIHENNLVEGLSSEQIRKIYTGEITNWNQVGGQDIPIHAYQREPNSGSRELMDQLVMNDLPAKEAPDLMLPTMFAPFYAVSSDIAGIGYSIFFYEENMAPLEEHVKLLAVDGLMPQASSIQNQAYPYTTEVYAVTRGDQPKDSLAYRLRAWLRSPHGQELIEKSGYVKR